MAGVFTRGLLSLSLDDKNLSPKVKTSGRLGSHNWRVSTTCDAASPPQLPPKEQGAIRKNNIIKLAVTAGFVSLLVISGIACGSNNTSTNTANGCDSAMGKWVHGDEMVRGFFKVVESCPSWAEMGTAISNHPVRIATDGPVLLMSTICQTPTGQHVPGVVDPPVAVYGSATCQQFLSECFSDPIGSTFAACEERYNPGYQSSPGYQQQNNASSSTGAPTPDPALTPYPAPAPTSPPPPPDGPPSSYQNPCALVTTSEANAAFGMTLTQNGPVNGTCEYTNQKMLFHIQVDYGTSMEPLPPLRQSAPEDFTPMAGIGDYAVQTPAGLIFQKGTVDVHLTLNLSVTPLSPQQFQILRTLAATAVGRV
jgi:hypothetical protein